MKLNDRFFKRDLLRFLSSRKDEKCFNEIKEWISEYDKNIEKTQENILNKFKKKFPSLHISMEQIDICTFNIHLFGVDSKEYDLVKKMANNITKKIEGNNEEYLFLVHEVTMEDVKKFYPREEKELEKIRKNK